MTLQLVTYQERLERAETKDALFDLLFAMDDGYTADALDVVRNMTDSDVEEWRAGLALERMGEENGEDWYDKYLDLLVPPPFAGLMMIAEGNLPEAE